MKYGINELYTGQYYETDFFITDAAGMKYAELSNDYNPIHLNQEAAEKSRFGKKIVHGMLIGSYFSGIIGNEFPGEGSIYISQKFLFKSPVYYNTGIRIRVEVTAVNKINKHIMLKTQCISNEGKILVDGEAEILIEG